MAGASPNAYAEAFAQVAARRKDLENRRGELKALLGAGTAGPGARPQAVGEAVRRALEDVYQVLTAPEVPGVVKRDALLPVVERVVCHKDGVEVVFAPGLFESEDAEAGAGGGDITDYTTCMGMRTQR
ncbi:MAG: hypothetical protein JO250_03815 [Armatimonadetes bacterium]|nr:hypothetical protein [Armatimonadota bacterium]